MLISEIESSRGTDSHFDETIASFAKKFLPQPLSESFYHFRVEANQLCPCLTAHLHNWFLSNPFSCKQLLPITLFNWLIFPVVLNAFFFLAQTVDSRGHVGHWNISPHLQPFSKYGRLNSIKGYLGIVCVRPYKARLQSVKWCHFQQSVWNTREFPRWMWFVSWVWILAMLKELVRVNVVSCRVRGLVWSL